MIITISGIPSSGKSTIAKRISNELGWERKSVGDIIKELAGNMHINEYYNQLKNNPEKEKEIDMKQKQWGEESDNFIIEGRTSFLFMPKHKSYNVFFSLSLKSAAERAYNKYVIDSKNDGGVLVNKYDSLEDAYNKIKQRLDMENERYNKLYGVNHLDMRNYDVIINADKSEDSVFKELKDLIMKQINSH